MQCNANFIPNVPAVSRGAYLYVPAGGCDTVRDSAKPIDDTLFFAGEATEFRLAGTVGDALRSAHRATKQIVGG